ncbi:MAG: hypothetical protein GY772_05320 [bacterium]|nr:hypothetical protein [bacterium]
MATSQPLRTPAALVFGVAPGMRIRVVLQYNVAYRDDAYIRLRATRNLAELPRTASLEVGQPEVVALFAEAPKAEPA